MTCFHIGLYPNDKGVHPVEAYEKKSKALDQFRDDFENNDGDEFKKLRPIMKDILQLHDLIQMEFAKYHLKNGGKPRSLEIMDKKPEESKAGFSFVFSGKQAKERLQTGALYPILAAFRWMVEEDADGNFAWRGGFDNVLARWKDTAPDLTCKTQERSKELGNNSNAIGKSLPRSYVQGELTIITTAGRNGPPRWSRCRRNPLSPSPPAGTTPAPATFPLACPVPALGRPLVRWLSNSRVP